MAILNELSKNITATVKSIGGSSKFRKRLFSLGLTKGSSLEIKRCSMRKQTIEIEVNNITLIALRNQEAKFIEVEEL